MYVIGDWIVDFLLNFFVEVLIYILKFWRLVLWRGYRGLIGDKIEL